MKVIKLYFALFLLGAGLACTKTTIAEGVVSDAGTGLPIPGVVVELWAVGYRGGNTEKIDFQRVKTDNEGRFGLDVEGKKISYVLMYLGKEGYGIVGSQKMENGEKLRNIERVLYPYDATVALEMVNASGASEFYHRYTGEFYGGETDLGPLGHNPLKQSQGADTVEYIKVLGGGLVDILWSTKSSSGSSAEQKYSVFCPRNDTTYVQLAY